MITKQKTPVCTLVGMLPKGKKYYIDAFNVSIQILNKVSHHELLLGKVRLGRVINLLANAYPTMDEIYGPMIGITRIGDSNAGEDYELDFSLVGRAMEIIEPNDTVFTVFTNCVPIEPHFVDSLEINAYKNVADLWDAVSTMIHVEGEVEGSSKLSCLEDTIVQKVVESYEGLSLLQLLKTYELEEESRSKTPDLTEHDAKDPAKKAEYALNVRVSQRLLKNLHKCIETAMADLKNYNSVMKNEIGGFIMNSELLNNRFEELFYKSIS